jgi:hypothetical protein
MMCEVEVYLDQFGDDEILARALAIVQKRGEKLGESMWEINELRDYFLSKAEDETLPPASTAAKIHSVEDLRAWTEREKAA